jgi:hypothetical protein
LASSAALLRTLSPLNPASDPNHPDWPAGNGRRRSCWQPNDSVFEAGDRHHHGQDGRTARSATSGLWNFYGFDKADNFAAIPDPADSQQALTGNWIAVPSGRVDVFLQQCGLIQWSC